MKKTFLISLAIILIYSYSLAQDTIPAGNVSGTWSDYRVRPILLTEI